MKLESLQLEKFKENSLKREQMFSLNGGGTKTPAGVACGTARVYPYRTWIYNYGYDVDRDGVTTFHDRTDHEETTAENCAILQGK